MERRSLLSAATVAFVAASLGACAAAPEPAALDSAANAKVQIGAIHWYVDYEAAVAVAREQDRALWVHFGETPG